MFAVLLARGSLKGTPWAPGFAIALETSVMRLESGRKTPRMVGCPVGGPSGFGILLAAL